MAVVEGTHVSVGITHRTAAAQSVRAAAQRQTCFYSEESTFQEPFYKFFLCILMLSEHLKRLRMKIFCRFDRSLVGGFAHYSSLFLFSITLKEAVLVNALCYNILSLSPFISSLLIL